MWGESLEQSERMTKEADEFKRTVSLSMLQDRKPEEKKRKHVNKMTNQILVQN